MLALTYLGPYPSHRIRSTMARVILGLFHIQADFSPDIKVRELGPSHTDFKLLAHPTWPQVLLETTKVVEVAAALGIDFESLARIYSLRHMYIHNLKLSPLHA
jgi:hypothetical protein